MVLMGSRPSSRRAAIRLTRLVPNRCRPTATSRRGSWGSLRFRHSGHLRAMKTCSVTSAGHTGSSMTSRVRCTQPPLRVVWHSGQDSGAWTTCRVAFHPRPGKAAGTLPARFLLLLRQLPAPGGRLVARHPAPWTGGGQPGLQALHPLPQSGIGVPQLRYHCQQGFPARLGQVQSRFHCPFMPQPRLGRQCFSAGPWAR